MPSRLESLNRRVFTVILLVALPVLIVGTALVVNIGQNRLRESESARLGQVAEYTAGAVDAYVFRRILDAALLGRVPELRAAAAAGTGQQYDQAQATEL